MRNAPAFVLKIALLTLLAFRLLPASPLDAFAADTADTAMVPAQHINDVFDVANEEYKAGNFEGAVRLYEGLLSGSGMRAVDIWYNLGNAYFKLHNYGRAIASYRRALRLAPRDQDIIANLNYVREMTRDKIDQPKSTELLHEIFLFHYSVNQAESEIFFLCFYLAATVFATVCLFRKSRFLRWLTYAVLVLALLFGGSTLLRWYGTANADEAVVVVAETDVHTGPGGNYMVSFNLHDGAELKVHKQETGWFQVELPDGRRGWLRGSHIEVV